MKKLILFPFIVLTILLFSFTNASSQYYCPNSTPGCTVWQTYIQSMPFIMDDGTVCLGAIFACKRCCGNLVQFYIDTVMFDEGCVYSHPIGLNGSSFHNQVSTHLLSNLSLCGATIPLCDEQSNIIATISYAPCYKWGTPIYTVGGTKRPLIACNNEIGCSENYTVCWDGTKFIWTLVSQSYSAVCPTSPGYDVCFGVCLNP